MTPSKQPQCDLESFFPVSAFHCPFSSCEKEIQIFKDFFCLCYSPLQGKLHFLQDIQCIVPPLQPWDTSRPCYTWLCRKPPGLIKTQPLVCYLPIFTFLLFSLIPSYFRYSWALRLHLWGWQFQLPLQLLSLLFLGQPSGNDSSFPEDVIHFSQLPLEKQKKPFKYCIKAVSSPWINRAKHYLKQES